MAFIFKEQLIAFVQHTRWNSYWEISYTGKGTSCTGFPFFMLVM